MPEKATTEQNTGQFKQPEVLSVEKIDNPQAILEESIETLAIVGGFDLLEMAIDGIQNVNPERKARKRIFLTEAARKG